jgi:hypothetical protein
MREFEIELRKLIALGDFKNQGILFHLSIYVDPTGQPDFNSVYFQYNGKTETVEFNKHGKFKGK